MADYSKTTNFAVKDGLTSGTAAKKIVGSEFDVEFNNLQTAIATKADLASPAFTSNATAVNLTVSGTTTLAGNLTVSGTTTLAGNLTGTLVGTFTIDGGTF
jgi:hypothetical protein